MNNTTLKLLKIFPELDVKPSTSKTTQNQYNTFLNTLAKIFVWYANSRSEHNKFPGCKVIFPEQQIKWRMHRFNSYKFNANSILNQYTYPHHTWKSGEYARPWEITSLLTDRLEKFVDSLSTSEFENLIKSSNPKHISVKVGASKRQLEKSFNSFDKIGLASKFSMREIKSELLTSGSISYSESNCGRLHSSVQSIKKIDRSIIFDGWYNYDIKCAAPSILTQIYKKQSGLSTPFIDAYINNRTEIRETIAKEADLSVKSVKSVITSLFFGVTLPTENQINYDVKQNSEQKKKELDPKDEFIFSLNKVVHPTTLRKILLSPFFQNLVEETKEIFAYISSSAKKSSIKNSLGEWEIENAIGKKLSLKRWSSSKVVAHIYFGHEREILNSIINSSSFNGAILIHDGFISPEKNNAISLLEEEIFTNTNFSIQLEEELIIQESPTTHHTYSISFQVFETPTTLQTLSYNFINKRKKQLCLNTKIGQKERNYQNQNTKCILMNG